MGLVIPSITICQSNMGNNTEGNDNNNNNNILSKTISHSIAEYLWKPKITVKCKHSLYHLTYSEIYNNNTSSTTATTNNNINEDYTNTLNHDLQNSGLGQIKDFNIMLFIDIPTIDYYNDELHDIKLSKFNKRFKLNKLKYSIWKSFTNNDSEFWDKLIQSHNLNNQKFNCKLSIYSSGSLRYVETIKFLIESIYEMIKSYTFDLINLTINLNVSNISLKWFKNFLPKPLLKIIKFNEISTTTTKNKNNTNIDSPFKEYFNKLNEKFSYPKSKCLSDTLETIIIITNSTGIKALLTILADKPLTNFIDQSSIDELYNTSLNKSNMDPLSRQISNNSTTSSTISNNNKDFLNSGGTLRRESSSLLNFQNSLLTSNKDKAVRIRSLSINRRTNKFLETQSSPSKIPFKTQIISTHKEPFSVISRTKDILQLIDLEDKKQQEQEETDDEADTSSIINDQLLSHFQKTSNDHAVTFADTTDDEMITDEEEEINSDEDFFDSDVEEEEEEEDSESGEEDDNDEGISFYVPSLLSRSGSSSDFNSMSPAPIPRRGRFRSLSLMDPAQRQPFNLDERITTTNENPNSNLYITKSYNETNDKPKTKSFTNIYIHDGNFNDNNNTYNQTNKNFKRKNIPNFINIHSNNNNTPINNNSNNNNNINGLIPPEFYSRISTPSPSNNNSGTSLNSNYLSSYDSINEDNTLSPSYNNNARFSSSQVNLFEKNLVNKSFELNRTSNKSVENIFNRLINKKNEERNKYYTLMNFNDHGNGSNSSPHHNILRALDEEDQMLGAVQEGNINIDTPQQPPTGVPYKVHNTNNNSSNTSTTNLSFYNDDTDMDGNSYNNMTSKESTLTRLNLNLYDHQNDKKDNEDSQEVGKIETSELQSPTSKPTTFKRITSLDLYGSNDDQLDDNSSNMWVLGGNR